MNILEKILSETSMQRYALVKLFLANPMKSYSRKEVQDCMMNEPFLTYLTNENTDIHVWEAEKVPTSLIERLDELVELRIIELKMHDKKERRYKLNRFDTENSTLDNVELKQRDLNDLESIEKSFSKYKLPFTLSIKRLIDLNNEINKGQNNGISYSHIDFETPFIKDQAILEITNNIYYAIKDCNPILNLKYKGHFNSNREPLEQNLKIFYPYILKEARGQWYVVGKCPGENTFRNIPIERIINKDFEVNEDETFVREAFDASTYWDGCVSITKIGEPINITFHLRNGEIYNNVDYLKSTPIIKKGQTVKSLNSEWSEVKLKNIYMGPELVRIIRSFGLTNIQNVSPKWLNEDLFETGERKQFIFSVRLTANIDRKAFETEMISELRLNSGNDNASARLSINEIPNKKGWLKITLDNILINSILSTFILKTIKNIGEQNYTTKMNTLLN
jgi:hypothetical protein